jgi:hypothetical protein
MGVGGRHVAAVAGCISSRGGVLDLGDRNTAIAEDLRPCLAGDALGNRILTPTPDPH